MTLHDGSLDGEYGPRGSSTSTRPRAPAIRPRAGPHSPRCGRVVDDWDQLIAWRAQQRDQEQEQRVEQGKAAIAADEARAVRDKVRFAIASVHATQGDLADASLVNRTRRALDRLGRRLDRARALLAGARTALPLEERGRALALTPSGRSRRGGPAAENGDRRLGSRRATHRECAHRARPRRHQRLRGGLVGHELELEGSAHALELLLQLRLDALGVALEVAHPAAHPVDLLLELEDALHAGEVHAELAGELLDPAQPVHVLLRVQALFWASAVISPRVS